MSSIPTNIVNLNFPEEEGGGGGDSRGTLEALARLQDAVGRIHVTLRAILEAVKVRGTREARGASDGSGGAGGGRGVSGDVAAARAVAREARLANMRAMREARLEGVAIRRRFERTGRVSATAEQQAIAARFVDPTQRAGLSGPEFALGSSISATQHAASLRAEGVTQREAASAARRVAREAAAAARLQARENARLAREAARASAAAARRAAADAARAGRTSTNALSEGQQARLFQLRHAAATPGAGFALSSEEQGLVSGEASPLGARGRRYAAGVMAANRAYQRRLARENRPPPIPRAPGGGGGADEGGFMSGIDNAMETVGGVLGPIGRILAVGRMLVGMVQQVVQVINSILAYSKEQRHSLGMLDPVIAKQNATVMIAGLMDRMALAQTPLIRSSSAEATQAELIRLGGTHNVRAAMTIGANKFSAMWDRSIGYLGMGLEGDLRGLAMGVHSNPIFNYLAGWSIPGGSYISTLLGWAFGDKWMADLDAKALARVRSQTGIFIGDLHMMTGGRFSLAHAYPRSRVINGTRYDPGKSNWWRYGGDI